MADNKAQLVVDGDVSPLRQKLREAGRDLKQFGDEGKSAAERIGGPLAALQSKFIAIGAVLAGGAVFKQAVSEAAAFTEESMKLGNALGISATEASTFIAALADIDVSQQEFIGSAKGLLKEVKNNEEGLQAMGLVTRDAAGNLRPLNELMVDAVDVLNDYKVGTDRAIAGQALFGKGFDINGNLTKLNSETLKENAELQKSLGLIVGVENVEAWQAYDQAMDQSTLTAKAMQTTVGNALIPVLTKLGEWFVAIGPAAIVVIKGAIGGLISVFWGLKTAVGIVFQSMNAAVITVAEPIRAVGAAFMKLLQGDFAGAKAEVMGITTVWRQAWGGAFENIVADATEARNKMWQLFADGGPSAAPAAGGKSADGLVKNSAGDKAAKDAAKALADRLKAEEDAFNKAVKLAEDYEAQWAREYAAVAAAARKSAGERMQIDLLQADGARNAGLARIAELEAQSAHEVAMGLLSQEQHLANMAQFNDMRLAEESRFLAAKRELALQDPDQNPVELERIEQEKADMRRRYAAQGMDIQRQQAIESQDIWQQLTTSISGLWDKGVQAMMNGTLTWRNAFQAIGAELSSWFLTNVVGKKVKAWLFGEAAQTGATATGTGTRTLLETIAAKKSVALWAATAAKNIMTSAWEAMAGAYKAIAGIPYVGPVLAPVAAAAAFAGVSVLAKNVMSAQKGYDVPKGLNPMTQLHEEEMVLPQRYANVIRGMAAGGTGDGGESSPQIHIHQNIKAWDSVDARRAFMGNQKEMVDAIKNAYRNGVK